MDGPREALSLAIKDYVIRLTSQTFDDVMKVISEEIELLTEQGLLGLGPDCRLTGKALEMRTRLILNQLGFKVLPGRPGLEDLILQPHDDISTSYPIIIEVKSSRQPQIKRDDLRQLDDWVFDLSQEEGARKHGLGGGFDPLAMASHGMLSKKKKHPTPHKGVMIFNGPIGTSFEKRKQECVSPNDNEFINKRNFCVIPFQNLIEYHELIVNRQFNANDLWKRLHETCGILSLP